MYKPFSPRPIREPKVFYGVCLGHVPGVNTSWKEAQPHTIGIRSDFKRFKTRQKAEAYVAQPVTLGQTPLSSPDAVFYFLLALGGGVPDSHLRPPLSCSGVPWLLTGRNRIE